MLNQLEFQRYIQASARRGNLGVRWVPGVVPHTDGQNVVLPLLKADATVEDYRKQLHYANHETNHILFTEFKDFAEHRCDASRSFLGFIWNACEDHRIEWLGGNDYEGDRANTDEVYPAMLEKGLTYLDDVACGKAECNEDRKQFLNKTLPILWFLNWCNQDLYASASTLTARIEKHITADPERVKAVDRLKAGDYLEVMRDIRDIADPKKGTGATFELAKRIYKEVFELDPEQELERLKNPPPSPAPPPPKPKAKPTLAPKGAGEKQEDEGESGESKPEDKDEKDGDEGEGGEGEGEKEEGEGEANGEGGGDDSEAPESEGDEDKSTRGDVNEASRGDDTGEHDTSTELREANYQEALPNSHPMTAPELRPSLSESGMKLHYKHVDPGSRDYVPATKDDYCVVDFCKKRVDLPQLIQSNSTYESCEIIEARGVLANGSGAGFASRVRTRLQIRSKDRFEFGVKKGKLHGSLLHRVPRNSELSSRVFKRQITNDTLDTAIVWLGDASGSMNGEKFHHLMAASVQFNEAVGNVLQVPIEIHCFTDVENPLKDGKPEPVMYVVRDFATRRLGDDELLKRMAVVSQHKYANPDGDAVMWSYDRLIRAKAKRKLLIVASDGSPSTVVPGDSNWYVKKVVKEIEEQGAIEIVGIGIMDRNVSRIYKEHYVINDASELETALLSLIDKKVR